MLVHRESDVFAGTAVADPPADDAPQSAPRPFGPFPRSVVALYGIALAGSGLTLCYMSGSVDAYWATGAGSAVAGLAFVQLAATRGRRPEETEAEVGSTDETAADETSRAAARVVGELEDLQQQIDELSEQCEAYTGIVAARMVSELEDLRRQLDELSGPETPDDTEAEPAPLQHTVAQWMPSDPRIAPSGTRSVRIAVPAVVSAFTLTAVLGRMAWGRARH